MAEKLPAEPVPPEVEPPASVSTRNPAAYGAFSQAGVARQGHDAIRWLERAVDLDGDFVEAHALLARFYAHEYFNDRPTEASRTNSRASLDQARKRAPSMPLVRSAEAYVAEKVDADFETALRLYRDLAESDERLRPTSVSSIGTLHMRMGDFARADRSLREAETALRTHRYSNESSRARDRVAVIVNLAELHRAQRNFEQADTWLELATRLRPHQEDLYHVRVLNLVSWRAVDTPARPLAEARTFLEKVSQHVRLPYFTRFLVDLYEASATPGDQGRVLYQRIVDRLEQEPNRTGGPRDRNFYFYLEANAYENLGRPARARVLVADARDALQQVVAQQEKPAPQESRLAIAHAYLGEHDEALRLAEKAVRATRSETYFGPRAREDRARVLTLSGRHEEALDEIDALLRLSYTESLVPAHLQLDPTWRSLRSHERFGRLAGLR